MTITEAPAADQPGSESAPDEAVDGPNSIIGASALVGGFLALGIFAGWIWVAIIVAIMVMIFFHELGHYLAAKSAGMQVTEFFLFFGPKLFSFRRGETEYGMKMIPAGAYVKITGMASFEEVDPAIEDRTYRQKPFWRRFSVAVAGSAMHFLMALVLLFGALIAYGSFENPDGNWLVDAITPGSAAEEAGLQPGDRLLAIDGQDATDFGDLATVLEPYVGDSVVLSIERDGQSMELATVIGARLTPEGAASIDGLLPFDILLAVGDTPVRTYEEFIAEVDGRFGQEIEVTAQGRGQPEAAVYTVVVDGVVDDAANGFLGVGPRDLRADLSVIEATGETFTTFGRVIKDNTVGLVRLLSPAGITDFLGDTFDGAQVVVDDEASLTERDLARLLVETPPEQSQNRITSIYGIVRLGTDASEAGLLGFLTFMMAVNVAIGVFNLIPALPFDGGHVVIAVYEKIRSTVSGRRYYADATKALPLIYVVLAFFIVISIVALGRDIVDPL